MTKSSKPAKQKSGRYKAHSPQHIYAVIIAGGSGKRFWPYSRFKKPKYFLKLPGQTATLLQQSASRVHGLLPKKNIIVVTNKLQAAEVKKQLPYVKIIAEPLSRNTAAAVALASVYIKNKDPESLIMVLPADQLISRSSWDKFKNSLKKAIICAHKHGGIVTIGIKPTFPSTGFGYIKIANKISSEVFKAEKFKEKPHLAKAKAFFKSKKYFWNGGIFIAKASILLDELKKCSPVLAGEMCSINSKTDLTALYRRLPNISFDYAVMEKSAKVFVVSSALIWYDVGSWRCLEDILPADKHKNICLGKVKCVDVAGSVVLSEGSHLVAVLGLKNIVIVKTKNATLVCDKDSVQQVKGLVDELALDANLRKYI